MSLTLTDRLLGRTGAHRFHRTVPAWQALQDRVATMADQDALMGDLVRQRDEQAALAAAAAAQAEDFRLRMVAAEERANRAEKDAISLRSQIANLTAISVPLYADGETTQELHLPVTRVRTLQDALGAA